MFILSHTQYITLICESTHTHRHYKSIYIPLIYIHIQICIYPHIYTQLFRAILKSKWLIQSALILFTAIM